MADASKKGRNARGERSPKAKLTEEQVREIRAVYYGRRGGKSNAKELAAKYGVTHGTIAQIGNGTLWPHVR